MNSDALVTLDIGLVFPVVCMEVLRVHLATFSGIGIGGSSYGLA